jgi:hypothetical protein
MYPIVCDGRRFDSAASFGFPMIIYVISGVLSRHLDGRRLAAQRRFVSIVSFGVSRLLLALFRI